MSLQEFQEWKRQFGSDNTGPLSASVTYRIRYSRVVTNPEKTQHCPYFTMYFLFMNFSSIATLPVQAVGGVQFLG